ncbi:hypothetical protein ACPPVU_24985 [Mucilaginibacter sp. McL0603]|uniref:hypothetical protein n=1 Tax=Mucilaginibacter sp. McL0603 TaxID=3415670 RepID=UPI003CE6CF32
MENEKIKDFIGKGAEIAGGAVGGAIGLIGGPVGAILGGALGAAFVVGIKEVINRQLSNRQEMRVAASTAYILTDVKEKLDRGYHVRTDSFFDATNGRSTAEELFEGILLKCKDQYQEKKSTIYQRYLRKRHLTAALALKLPTRFSAPLKVLLTGNFAS